MADRLKPVFEETLDDIREDFRGKDWTWSWFKLGTASDGFTTEYLLLAKSQAGVQVKRTYRVNWEILAEDMVTFSLRATLQGMDIEIMRLMDGEIV
jgi:hypothetical protein